jgi:hypothetical protein
VGERVVDRLKLLDVAAVHRPQLLRAALLGLQKVFVIGLLLAVAGDQVARGAHRADQILGHVGLS